MDLEDTKLDGLARVLAGLEAHQASLESSTAKTTLVQEAVALQDLVRQMQKAKLAFTKAYGEDKDPHDEDQTTDNVALAEGEEEGATRLDVLIASLFIFIEIPIMITLLAIVAGCTLAAFEGWTAGGGILYIVSNILGMGNPLGIAANLSPSTVPGSIIDLYISLLAIILLGLILAMIDNLPALDALKKIMIAKSEWLCNRKYNLTPGFMLLILIPVAVTCITLLFALLLAAAEGWTVGTGFLYVISNLLGLANPLTGNSPSANPGMILDCYISILAITVAGFMIAIVGELEIDICMASKYFAWRNRNVMGHESQP